MKNFIIWLVMQFLYRGMKVLYHDDYRIKNELDGWHKDKSIQLKVLNGPTLTIQYTYQKGLSKTNQGYADIVICFKSIQSAFLVFTGMMSVKQAYLEHRFSLRGDVNESMRFVRCVDLVEIYLFPRFMTKRILNHQEKKYKSTLSIYLKAIFTL
ncbi:hypothetical protein [Candidatus Stoquefichus sp. SB1]|uniref:hypothetical protein n=1 Tax=Candidatus Stoquefichus sp. SB1 TaxID=1658109 RepID=UPI00067E70AB|nr:hypothetical protein [Candidatus Stoquefichus sp. SB1]